MKLNRSMSAVAVVATGLTTAVALAATPADAVTGHAVHAAPAVHGPDVHAPTSSVAHARTGTHLSKTALASVRDRQQQLAGRVAPTFKKAAAKTFTVNTTEDYGLSTVGDTHCVDANTGKCSLRAAVGAANNLSVPVRIVLGAHTYTLSTATQIVVTSPHGVRIVGQGASKTAIAGAGSGLFYLPSPSGPGASLFLSSLKLKGGSNAYGGAVQIGGTSSDYGYAALSLDHVTATNNTASTAGGVVYANGYNTVSISHSSLSGNHSAEGGAIYDYWSNIRILDSTLNQNTSPAGSYGEGGAIYNYYGVIDVSGGSISHNVAGDPGHYGEGGALYDYYGQATFAKTHVDDNQAVEGYGGAVMSYEDMITVSGGTMSGNTALGSASASGGAIYVDDNSMVTLTGVTLAGNRASGTDEGDGGGTIYAYGYEYPLQVNISHSKITGSNNAAVYLYEYEGGIDASITESTLANNTANGGNGMSSMGCGGAVCAYAEEYGGLNLEMQGNKVSGNHSVGNYGAGAVTAYSYEYAQLSTVMRKNTFSNNHSGAYGYGGAVGFYSEDDYSPISVRMASNHFTGNRAGTQSSEGVGGAVSMYYAVSLSDTGSVFKNNRAIGNGAEGGAVYGYNYYGSTSYNRTQFLGNSAGTNVATNEGYGGAVYANTEFGTSLNQVTIAGNKAAYEGGGFYGDGDEYLDTIKASTFSGNTAGSSKVTGYGGGLYLDDSAGSVENSTFTGNKAVTGPSDPAQGGGIWFEGSNLALRYSTISGNYAKQAGGVYTDSAGSVVSSIISKNRTAKSGSESDCAADSPYTVLKSLGGNVVGQKGCVLDLQSGDKVSRDPKLGSLKSNGGPTKTMALSSKSPAVGRATYLIPSTDQRGHGRPSNHADAGAYELPKKH